VNVAVRDARWKDLIELVAGHFHGCADPANQRTAACLQRVAASADLADIAYVLLGLRCHLIIVIIIIIIIPRSVSIRSHRNETESFFYKPSAVFGSLVGPLCCVRAE